MVPVRHRRAPLTRTSPPVTTKWRRCLYLVRPSLPRRMPPLPCPGVPHNAGGRRRTTRWSCARARSPFEPDSGPRGPVASGSGCPSPGAPSHRNWCTPILIQFQICSKLQKFISIQILLRKIQIKYPHAQEDKPYLLVSLYSTTKILLYGANLKEHKCPFMVFWRYCKI